MSTRAPKSVEPADVSSRMFQHTRRALSAGACSAILAGTMLLGGGWPSSIAYADGYVDGSGNNIYYGYKTDASYSEARLHIEVDYYDTREHANAGTDEGKDPLGKFVRVHYLSNCNPKEGTADNWKFRPMWWYGVPKGLINVQNITYTRVEKLTNQPSASQLFKPAGSSQFTPKNAEGYGVVSQKTYPTPKDWKGISNFYFDEQNVLASKGWKQLLGIDNKGSKGYDNAGNTKGQWESYQEETAGLQGIFVDWESAGRRFYDMTYVAEMTDDAWEKRNEHPLRFAAGIYRFAGNWHYAVGQKHDTPKIADHLTLKYPDVTLVKNLTKLSNDEKGKVKEAIEKANRGTATAQTLFDKLVKDGQDGIVVNDDGSATITFKDQTTRTIPASLLVAKNEEDKDKYKPIMPARTPVVKPSQLTADDKEAVIKAFKEKNKDNKDFNDHLKAGNDAIKFNDDGSKLVVTYKDGSTLEIPASELVRQGATIADWAPYVVPDTMEVENLKQLKQDEIDKIVSAFDTANQGITPYDDAKTNNGNKAPVTVDKATGNATITWKDGSTTTIEAWQYLKEKAKQTPQPPAPAEEKTFIVEAPQTQTQVNFDPFKMTQDDLTNNQQTLDGVKSKFTGEKGKDAKDPTKKVNITKVEYSVDNGVGYVTFKADGYKPAKYPMSVFFKKKVTPYNPSSSTVGPDSAGRTFIVKKYPIAGNTPTDAEKKAALKQFIETNWNNATVDGNSDSYTGGRSWTPKPGTSGIGTAAKDGRGITTISVNADGDIVIKNDRNKEIKIVHDSLYEKNAAPQDTTLPDLKALAKKILAAKQQAGVTNKDLKKAGITDPANLNDADKGIDKMDEKTLRDLIRKLTDAKHYDRKYNKPTVEVENPDNLTEDDLKAAIKAFLEANYDNGNTVNVTSTSDITLPTNLTPKKDTVYMEVGTDGVTKIKSASKDGIVLQDGDGTTTFTVKPNFKRKAETPAPTPDALAQMKKDAQQQIDRNPNLTKEQKEQYKKDIKDATTVDKIKEILKKAADKGKENAKSTDPDTKKAISDNKGGGAAKKEAEDKKQKEEDKHNSDQLNDKKTEASDAIDKLDNLTPDEKDKLKKQINGDSTPQNPGGAATPEEVQKILDNAKNLNEAHKLVKAGELPFLDHGNAGEEKKDQPSHADDAALNELLGGTPGKDKTLTDLETALAKTNPAATAEELNNAVTAAKKANALNEQKAKDAANKQLTDKKDKLDNAYNALTEEQKKSAKEKYEAAVKEINDAKTNVGKATKPSEIKTALAGVKDETITAANKAISDAKGKRDTSNNTNDNADALNKEKKEQIERINKSDLPEADKKKAIGDIDKATKLGDPTGIADRALKAKKIKDALAAIGKLTHLNNAQKQAYIDIINNTEAKNHVDDNGKDTGKDDIDEALANATATDAAMARLETLNKTADAFKKDANGKYSKLGNSEEDTKKKKAFDDAFTAAGSVLDKATGDPKSAAEVKTIYDALLKAMQAIDNTVKGAGVSTDALEAEIDSDKTFKPDTTASPAKPGNPVYKTSSKAKQDAFDKALKDAEDALKKAKEDNAGTTPRTPEQEAQAQQAVDEALQKLQKAREELDGVNTKPLQTEIDKAPTVKNDVKYTRASDSKKQAYDEALKNAQDLIDKLTGKKTPSQDDHLDTKEAKQKALDAALEKIRAAYDALNGEASLGYYPLPAVIPSGSVDSGNTHTPADGTSDTGAAASEAGSASSSPANPSAPSADASANANGSAHANANAAPEAGAAAGAAADDNANASATLAPSRVKGHGKHARIAQTSDPFALASLAAPFAALAGALSLGAASSRKRLRFAKHLKR